MADLQDQESGCPLSGFLMVVDGLAGNAVELVSLDTTPVPSCLQSLNPAVQLYDGCLTTLNGGNVNVLIVE